MNVQEDFIALDTKFPIWKHFFTIAPLIVVGTKEGDGYDLAPKHMATPIGFDNYFGFVCTPRHSTYQNILANKEFSISFPLPDQVLFTSLSALPRIEEMSKSKKIVDALPTIQATKVDALLLQHSYLHLECELFKVIDGFNANSIITGKIIAASVHPEYLRESEKDENEQIDRFPLMAYVADGRYATVARTYNFPFPKDFSR
ncbi:flavin reductase [Sungkyunkwania multivorans]|uniref:Flavin reductase n=1 Tax=Sungkyunkwania multivorans TaxID=1173618 RepID=A0ABW3D174_9FLAO